MLENIATDFASMEAAAKADETTQQEEYDTWLTGSQMDKAAKEKDSEQKTSRKERLKEKLMGKQADLEHTEKELEAAISYDVLPDESSAAPSSRTCCRWSCSRSPLRPLPRSIRTTPRLRSSPSSKSSKRR
jgi:hypothetical protein